jgi:transcription antitermination factor NusG
MDKDAYLCDAHGSQEALARNYDERLWFAVYTTCRHEKCVARHLERKAIEHFLPLYRTQRRWKNGAKVTLDLPLFPGYVFIRIHRRERVNVLDVPGVLWIVGGTGSQPTPLPETEIETLRAALDPCRVIPFPAIAAGERVRIRGGALAGLEGIVSRQNNGFRVVITLDLIKQSIAVEVNAEDVEPVRAVPPAAVFSQVMNRGQLENLPA